MVFSSLPIYLDPPNWNQQTHQHTGGSSTGVGELPPQLQSGMASTQRQDSGIVAAGGSIRPGSMADRARLAKIPQPEPALKCPRCDSTNTKFCYFNNYSLTQPRHFCKTCRRYWTRGGALRNVPVGGGCRRNKRSKSTASGSSKSTSSAADRQAGASSSSSSTATSGSGVIPSNFPQHPQLPFLTSLHSLAEYGAPNLGLNFTGMQPIEAVDYQVGSSSRFGMEQWRLPQIQQFPFLGGLDTSSAAAMVAAPMPGVYPFDGESGADGFNGQVMPKVPSSGLITQMASVKMEDSNPQGLNFPRQYLGVPGNDQYWGGEGGVSGGWAGDLSGFNSSSSPNIL